MKTYYDQDGIRIYHGDYHEVLPALAVGVAGTVDLLLVDPPYGDTSLGWDKCSLDWLRLSRFTLKPEASMWCFGSLRMFMATSKAIMALGWKLAQDVIWEKHNGSGFHADRFKRVHEHVVQFYMAKTPWGRVYKKPVVTMDATARSVLRKKRPPHMGHIEASAYVSTDGGPRLMTSVIPVRSCHGYAEHPTQKPLGILQPLVEYSCPPNGLILDPTMGAGSTLVAAKSQGCQAIGIEVEEKYCEVAARRLENLDQETTRL